MAMFRAYESDSGLVSISATTQTQLLYLGPTSTNDTNIVRIKVSVEAVSSPAPPSNGSVFFQLLSATGTQAGGATVTPTQLSGATLAARTSVKSATTSITGMTAGSSEYWAGVVPFTAGAWSEDTFENTGLEINLAASSQVLLYFSAPSGAGSGLSARAIVWTTE